MTAICIRASATSTIARPPGVKLDSGGLAKGLFADVLAERLSSHASFAINCAGDLAIGGAGETVRPVAVESPIEPRSATIDPPPRITLSELSAFAQPIAMRGVEAG